MSEIKPSEYNPRIISEHALEGLEASIEKFGYVEPLIWNARTGNLVSGHQRYKILEKQKVKAVEVVVVDLSEEDEKKLNLTMNNEQIRGEWDIPRLRDLMEQFDDNDLDFGSLNLEELNLKYPEDDEEELDEFPSVDIEKETDYCCPKCGYEWNGKPRYK